MSVVHAFKYKGRIRLGRRLGALAFDTLTAFWDRDDLDVVMPVPLHPARCRRRGFNQSRILMRDWPALALARAASWKDLPQVTNAIARRRKTRQQTGLHRRERRENIRGAFSLVSGDAVDGKRVLLVDDVMTTGATVEECARVLRKGGARAVDVLTVARAL
jgi:ComF family protein